MIVAANIGVRDEVELIEPHLRHLQALGVDRIVVADTGSVDGTLEVLERWESTGDIDLLRIDQSDASAAFHFAARVLEYTLQRHAPDWVLFGDADEFPIPRTGDLRGLLQASDVDLLQVPRLNVAAGPDGPWWASDLGPAGHAELQLIVRPRQDPRRHLQDHPDAAWILGAVQPKVIARPVALRAGLIMGAHAAVAQGLRQVDAGADLLLAHVAVSSRDRFLQKMANIDDVFRRAGHLYKGAQAWHWRRWHDLWQRGEAEAEYERQLFDAPRLAALRSEGVVASAAEWFAARARPPSA